MTSECCSPCLGNRGNSKINKQPSFGFEELTGECCSPCHAHHKHTHRFHGHEVPDEPLTAAEFWKKDVVAATVSGPGYRDYDHARSTMAHFEGYELESFYLDAPTYWHSWLEWLGGYPAWFQIEAYTEYRHLSPISPFLRIAHSELEGASVGVFIILETCSTGHSDSSRRALCVEKFADQLEIMVGRKNEPPGVLVEFAKKFRATGEPRGVHAWKPIKKHDRCEVGPGAGMQEITILDLLRWINGHLAKTWVPYDGLHANSYHLAMELQFFLKHGCPEHEALDRELVMHAVMEDGMNLQLASESMRADKEVVIAAVGNDPNALQYVAHKMQSNREVVLTALGGDGMALRFAARELQDDEEIVGFALRQNGRALLFASPELQANRKLAITAVMQDPWAMQFAAEKLRADRETMLQVVAIHGTALRYASEKLRADRQVVRAAVEQDPNALRLASDELQADVLLQLMAHPQDNSKRERHKPQLAKEKKEKKKTTLKKSWKNFKDDPGEVCLFFAETKKEVDYKYNF